MSELAEIATLELRSRHDADAPGIEPSESLLEPEAVGMLALKGSSRAKRRPIARCSSAAFSGLKRAKPKYVAATQGVAPNERIALKRNRSRQDVGAPGIEPNSKERIREELN
ncbi:MAG: hypothetical protein K2X77_18170 [Candidatus Obscuribacterales bacterium]|nr:hypothetical protein [Candidatus Obscuribacterales bacterium]